MTVVPKHDSPLVTWGALLPTPGIGWLMVSSSRAQNHCKQEFLGLTPRHQYFSSSLDDYIGQPILKD